MSFLYNGAERHVTKSSNKAVDCFLFLFLWVLVGTNCKEETKKTFINWGDILSFKLSFLF